jgi:hypothetical protein
MESVEAAAGEGMFMSVEEAAVLAATTQRLALYGNLDTPADLTAARAAAV